MYINQYKFEAIPTIGFVGGIIGFIELEIEGGIGLNLWETRPKNETFTKPFLGCSFSAKLFPYSKDLIGESFDIWLNGLILFGLNQNYYKKGDLSTWGLKPYLGFELYGIQCSYGYNIFLTENEIEELSNHIFTMRYFLPIVKLKKSSLNEN